MHALHTVAYPGWMPLVQVRDVRAATVKSLRAQAAERGMSLTAFLRVELDRLAARPTNADVVARMAARNRRGGPTEADTVAEIRRIREAS